MVLWLYLLVVKKKFKVFFFNRELSTTGETKITCNVKTGQRFKKCWISTVTIRVLSKTCMSCTDLLSLNSICKECKKLKLQLKGSTD